MSMRKSSRSELRMLRVMMSHFGLTTKCFFCKKSLLKLEDVICQDGELHIAGKTPPQPIKTKLTIHHEDGNHYNNDSENRKPCHSKCHKSFHMHERQAEKAKRLGDKIASSWHHGG